MQKLIGDKNVYLTPTVHLVGVKEVIDCKNGRSEKLQKRLSAVFILFDLFFFCLVIKSGDKNRK